MPKVELQVITDFLTKIKPKYDTNGAILIECRTLHNIVTSAAEAETHGVFYNAKQSIPIRHTLEELGHK